MDCNLNFKNEICSIYIEDGFKNFNSSLIKTYKNQNIHISSKEIDINNIYDKVLIITDENVYNMQLDFFIENIEHKNISTYTVESGEKSKSIEVYEKAMEFCKDAGLTRKSLIIALGGGVVGDLAGFVASTYMRGIDVIQVPTTLLSQVDSSIGGKTGINLGSFKNIIGTFYRPKLTYTNISTLISLPKSEFRSGMAEVIKYGFINDIEIIDYLINNSQKLLDRNLAELTYIVGKCAMIKYKIVSKDEKESGLRKILNFGHTFGHGVEKICGISHGEAVCIGMNMAFKYSLKKGMISNDYYKKFISVCKEFNLPIEFTKADEIEIYKIMKSDKKNSFNELNLILPVGEAKVKSFAQDYNSIEKDILEIISMCKSNEKNI